MKPLRNIWAFFWILFFSQALAAQGDFFAQADAFLKRWVDPNGGVDYRGIQKSPAALRDLMEEIARFPAAKVPGPREKAFAMNAYNIVVIHHVVAHYPLVSVNEVPSFFKKDSFWVGGKKVTLDLFENQWIRPVFRDPRVHFALVCGAKSCPNLPNRAYLPENVEAMLGSQTKMALNQEKILRFHREENVLELSQIFQWYAADFEQAEGSVLAFVRKHHPGDLPREVEVRYLPYDWGLNQQK